MRSKYHIYKQRAIELRKAGKTYREIKKTIGVFIPKSTMSDWFRNVVIPSIYQKRLDEVIKKNIQTARNKALATNKIKRERYIKDVRTRVSYLINKLNDDNTAKVALAMLYLGEGSKTRRGSLMFGNSSPLVIDLFLNLLRKCYDINEKKFRCTVQCRADQDTLRLEKFWSKITKIPQSQFYKTRVDPRTIGHPSQKINYKGVCRIDYFSGDIFTELEQIINLILGARSSIG